MKQWLRRLTGQGRTVFVTSHVLGTVERLCDRVAIVMRPGKLVWQGDITVLARDGALNATACLAGATRRVDRTASMRP